MKAKQQLSTILMTLVVVFLASCKVPTPPPPTSTPTLTPIPATKTLTSTSIPPTLTLTPVPPTATHTSTDTATLTSTQTATVTNSPTLTPTATDVPPVLIVEQDAVCRTGPGTNFRIYGYQTAGDEPQVLGKLESDPIWWVIQLAEKDAHCWISDLVVSVAGNVASLPLMTPPPTPTKSAPSVPEGEGIYYFLVAEDSGGPFACGDSLLYIFPGIERTGELEIDITNALTALFSNKHQYYNGLYNPMYASNLRVDDVDAIPEEPEIQVYLRGDFAKPIDKCDALRMRAQVWETIEIQFPEVQHAVITVHNALLGDLLVTGW